MKICIGNDHRGYELKTKLVDALKEKYDITDLGSYDSNSTDYPIYGFKVGESVAKKENDFGIVICGSGIGISIACNKVKGVRCAKVDNVNDAFYTRNDNDANVVSFSSEKSFEEALEIVEKFINTPFSNLEKHNRRINLISSYELGEYNDR